MLDDQCFSESFPQSDKSYSSLAVRYLVMPALVAIVKFTKISNLSKIVFLDLDDFGL